MISFPNNPTQTTKAKSTHEVDSFPFDLVHEVEVTLIKLMNSDVTIFATTAVPLARRISRDGILRNISKWNEPTKFETKAYQGAEVTTDTANLVLEDLVIKSGLEFALPSGRCRDVGETF